MSTPGTGPRIAVGPGPAPWAAEAIRRGGGEVVGLDEDPVGLVWTDGGAMDALRSVLATRPKISWVQLPQAGVERAFQAGAVDRQRLWTSAKGAFADPVAEHALALILAGLRQLKVRARARTWGEPAGESLFGQPVTVVGAGGIATVLMRCPPGPCPTAGSVLGWRSPRGETGLFPARGAEEDSRSEGPVVPGR